MSQHDPSPPTESRAPAAVSPQRHLLGSRPQLADAVDTLLALRPRLVRIAATDGSAFELDTRRVVDALQLVLLADRLARVRILIDASGFIDTRAPRLKLAQRRHPHALEIRLASTDDPVGDDVHFIADQLHCIDVRAARLVSGEMWLNNRSRAQPLAASFDRRWDTAAHNLPVAPLGL